MNNIESRKDLGGGAPGVSMHSNDKMNKFCTFRLLRLPTRRETRLCRMVLLTTIYLLNENLTFLLFMLQQICEYSISNGQESCNTEAF